MKPKHLPLFFSFLRRKPRVYPPEIIRVELADGPIDYANWTHPFVGRRGPSQGWIDTLRSVIRPGDVCIDIGALSGDTTVPMALAAGPTGACLAFEPNPFVFPTLQANAGLNPDRMRIIPFAFAIGEKEEPMVFHYSDADYCNGGLMPGLSRLQHGHMFPLEVQVRRLDTVLAGYPDLEPRLRYIKVDTEGYDLAILQSIRPILARRRPYVQAEVFHRLPEAPRREMFDLLTGLGYRVWRLNRSSQLRGEPLAVDGLMQSTNYDIFAEPEEAAPAP